MAKALKTQKNNASVKEFLDAVADEGQRKDAKIVASIMQDITGKKPAMWGTSIVGYGSYHYKGKSGQGGDWPVIGFAPRKAALTLYLTIGFGYADELLRTLGKHKTGGGCLYIKSLDDVHLPTLKKLVRQSYQRMKQVIKERDWTLTS